jgi:hypothetical protein
MNADVADGLLVDVRGIGLADLCIDGESGLDQALSRLLASDLGTNFNSFSSSI